MSTELTIIKSNIINEFRYTLNREEQKLMLYAISQLKEDEEIYKNGFTIFVADLLKILDLDSSKDKYSQVKRMTRKLISAVYEEETDDDCIQMSIFNMFHYDLKGRTGSIKVLMNPMLITHFIDLKKQFVKYKLNNVMILKSGYSIRIYELLKQCLYKSKISFTLEELRWKLGIKPSEYKRYRDFRRNILDITILEINQKTDIKFNFNEIRRGRTVVAIEFEIYENNKNDTEVISMTTGELSIVKSTQQPIQNLNSPLTTIPKTPNTPRPDLLQKAKSLGIPDHLTNKWIDSKGEDKVDEKLELLIKRNKTEKIASPVGFFISAIQQDWQDETKETKLTEEDKRELRKENLETVMMEPLSFSDEVAFYEEMARLQNDYYIPRWAERDMIQAEQNWARVTV
jgi:plasmid replication initiation protein